MGIGKRFIKLFMSAALLGATLGAVTAVPSADPAAAQVPYTFEEVAEIDGLTDVHARTFRLYWAFFDRQPDPAGALYWANQVNQCWSLERIANFFATSDEFVATYGTLTDGEFVDLIYRNVLDRPAEPSGRAFWVSEIATGARSRVQVMLDFAYSDEFVRAHPLPSSGIPDEPCSTSAAAIPAPGSDGAVLLADVMSAMLPTPMCGGFIRSDNNVLTDGVTDGSTFTGEPGAYARVRQTPADGPYADIVRGDLDSNGIDDAAFVLECVNALGIIVDTPLIVMLDTGPAYTFEPQDESVLAPTGGTAGFIEALAYRDAATGPLLEVRWRAYGPEDPICCPSIFVSSYFAVADGTFTRDSFFVDGPDAIAQVLVDFVLSDEYAPIEERMTFSDFSTLHDFQSTRGGLNFDGTGHCTPGGPGYVCLVSAPSWGQIGFLLRFEDGIWKLDSIAYDI